MLPIFFYAAWLLIGGFSPNLYAQALPTSVLKDKVLTGKDAQELLRWQEHERRLRQQQEHTPDVHLSNEDKAQAAEVSCKLPTSETPCFPIELIVLKGEESHRFAWALQAAHRPDDPPSGRCLGVQGINLVMKRVQNAIIERGYVTTRVLAETQDLKSGVLTLTVIPGRLHTIRFTAKTARRATQWNAVPIKAGDLLNLRDIEQSLENFKRLPTVEANIDIIPAAQADAQPGESDLMIDWRQGLPVRLTLSADDAGSKATGKYQGNVSLSVDHWWTLNDLFYVSFSQGLRGGGAGPKSTRGHTIHYSVPLGYWLLGLTASRYGYQQTVAGPYENYMYSGTSQNNEIKLSRLLYRDASRKLTASLRGYFKESSSFIEGTELDHHRRRLAGWELALAHREYIGRGALAIQVAHQRGTGALNALPAAEAESGEGTSYPKLFSAEVALDMPFTLAHQKIRYNGVWRAQWQRTPLLPQDRFSLGGRYTVRGFDGELTLLAERGWLMRNDLGLALGSSGQELYVGVDYGQLGGPSTEFLPGSRLAGGVIGLRGGFKNVQYDVFAGRPFKKPEVFDTANVTAGFSASYAF